MRIRRKRNSNNSNFSPNPPQSSLPPSRGWGELQAKSESPENSSVSFTPTPKSVQAQGYTLGEVGDVYEREADVNAQRVVEQINSPQTLQRSQETEGEEELQMKPETLARSQDQGDKIDMKPLHGYLQRMAKQDPYLNPQQEIQRHTEDGEQQVQAKPLHGYLQRMARGENESNEVQTKPLQQKPFWGHIQRSDGGDNSLNSEFESTLNHAKRTGGQSLQPEIQAKMGQAMGADFSGVKVHTDATSDGLSQSIQAKAFTTGQDVFFKRGEYNPSSRGGQELIAHELTHVVQQNGSSVQRQVQSVATSLTPSPNDSELAIQAKFMSVSINKNTTVYGGDQQPDSTQSLQKLKTKLMGANPSLEVDPNQTYMDNANKRWVRARSNNQSGWIKWEHVRWHQDTIPELEHKTGDKFFGLAEPFNGNNAFLNNYKGYGTRKDAAVNLYKRVEVNKDAKVLEKLDQLRRSKGKTQKAKLKVVLEAIEIGRKLYESGNFDENIQASNEHLINTLDDYTNIPVNILELEQKELDADQNDSDTVKQQKENVRLLNEQDRQLLSSIKNDSHWQNRTWFAASGNGRDTGHRSKMALRATIRTGSHVHFLLDGVVMEAVVNPQSKYYDKYTCKELRHLHRYWDQYRDHVTFWLNERPSAPPWDLKPDLWNHQEYAEAMRRESLVDVIQAPEDSKESD